MRRAAGPLAAAAVAVLWASPAGAQDLIDFVVQSHPRLIATPRRLAAARRAIESAGSHHQEAFGALKARVDAGDWKAYADAADREGARRSCLALDAAAMFLLTGEKKYAAAAFREYQQVLRRRMPGGLVRGEYDERIEIMVSARNFALVYDWTYNALTDAQRKAYEGVLGDIRKELSGGRGARSWQNQAIYQAVEVLLILALYADKGTAPGPDGQTVRFPAYDKAKQALAHTVRSYFSDLGVYAGGAHGAAWACPYLLAAMAAVRGTGDKAFEEIFRDRPVWTWVMYAGQFQQSGPRGFLQSGSGAPRLRNEGWVSQLIPHVPPDRLPHYLWFYDRHMGRLSPGPPATKYDNNGGTVFALLDYPAAAKAEDPTGVLAAAAADRGSGLYFFRNRWKDADDILVGFTSNLKGGHRSAAGEIQLAAFGTRFVMTSCGGGNTCSSLLVSGINPPGGGGRQVAWEPSGRGGCAVVDGGTQYAALDVTFRRHLLVDFAPGANAALLSTLDRAAAETDKTFTWNAHVPREVKVAVGEDAGRPSFTLTGRCGFVKGWLLHSPDGTFESVPLLATRKPGTAPNSLLQVNTVGRRAAEYWVVLYVGGGKVPEAKITGEGLQSVVRIAGRTVRYDAAKDRVVAGK